VKLQRGANDNDNDGTAPAIMNSKDEPIQPWSGKAGEPFRSFRNRLRLYLGTKTDKSGSSVDNYLDGDDIS